MLPARIISLRSFVRQTAAISSSIRLRPLSAQAAPAEKIQRIVSDISQLTLIEVAELNQLLKTTLNIPDAPVMAYGGPAAGPAVTQQEEEDEAPKAKVQSSFTVKLVKFDDSKKIALIKEIKNIVEGMNLVQAKKFVESLPAVVRADISKEEADKLQDVIAAAGGICEIV
nr:EOG090X0O3H [Eurycercus lamellatus]